MTKQSIQPANTIIPLKLVGLNFKGTLVPKKKVSFSFLEVGEYLPTTFSVVSC